MHADTKNRSSSATTSMPPPAGPPPNPTLCTGRESRFPHPPAAGAAAGGGGNHESAASEVDRRGELKKSPLSTVDAEGNGPSEMWEWQSPEFDLQKDLVPAPSSSLWAETNNSVIDSWSMFDEQTPIKECTDIDLPFCDIGDITIKDFDEGKETLQAKRRRMLQFCPENVEMECPMTDGLLESLQVDLDFSSDEHLLLADGTEELPEEWLVDCSQDSVPGCPPAEMNSPPSVSVQANISALQISLVEEQSSKTVKKPPQSRPTPLKAGRNILRARKQKATVAYPFELIKPCGFRGDTTLRDINQKIHAPPPYRIRHKYDDEPVSYQASAISGKPVVHKTKIHTEGGKGSITITRTRG